MRVTTIGQILARQNATQIKHYQFSGKINSLIPTLLFRFPGIVGCKEYDFSTG